METPHQMMCRAIMWGDAALMKRSLAEGADPAGKFTEGNSPMSYLSTCMERSFKEGARVLIAHTGPIGKQCFISACDWQDLVYYGMEDLFQLAADRHVLNAGNALRCIEHGAMRAIKGHAFEPWAHLVPAGYRKSSGKCLNIIPGVVARIIGAAVSVRDDKPVLVYGDDFEAGLNHLLGLGCIKPLDNPDDIHPAMWDVAIAGIEKALATPGCGFESERVLAMLDRLNVTPQMLRLGCHNRLKGTEGESGHAALAWCARLEQARLDQVVPPVTSAVRAVRL